MTYHNTPVETLDGFEFSPRLDDACQFSTIYRDGVPMATLQRRRVYEEGPEWKLFSAPDGEDMGAIWLTGYTAVAMRASYRISKRLGE